MSQNDETPTATPPESPCSSPTSGIRYRGIQNELVPAEAEKALPHRTGIHPTLQSVLNHSHEATLGVYGTSMIFASIFAACISTNAMYGFNWQVVDMSINASLLDVQDYHLTDNQRYAMYSDSPVCAASVTIGSLTVVVCAIVLAFKYAQFQGYTHKLVCKIQSYTWLWMVVTSITGFILFCTISAASAGLTRTCKEFEKTGAECWVIFDNGFYDNMSHYMHRMSSATLRTGIAFGWLATLSLSCASLLEFIVWRYDPNMKQAVSSSERYQNGFSWGSKNEYCELDKVTVSSKTVQETQQREE